MPSFRRHLSSASCFILTNCRLERLLYVKLKDWLSNSVDPDDTAQWAVSSGSMLFAKAYYCRLWQWKSLIFYMFLQILYSSYFFFFFFFFVKFKWSLFGTCLTADPQNFQNNKQNIRLCVMQISLRLFEDTDTYLIRGHGRCKGNLCQRWTIQYTQFC